MENSTGGLEIRCADGENTDMIDAPRNEIQNFNRGLRPLRLANCGSLLGMHSNCAEDSDH